MKPVSCPNYTLEETVSYWSWLQREKRRKKRKYYFLRTMFCPGGLWLNLRTSYSAVTERSHVQLSPLYTLLLYSVIYYTPLSALYTVATLTCTSETWLVAYHRRGTVWV